MKATMGQSRPPKLVEVILRFSHTTNHTSIDPLIADEVGPSQPTGDESWSLWALVDL